MKVIPQSFFARDSHLVAKELIGQKLCRQNAEVIKRYTIDEVEVYDGFEDRASHAFGKAGESGRSSVMFGPPGIWYVYLCYGIHWMLNVVTREKGYPAAILIRGCREVSGPGRLSRELKIDRKFNDTAALPESLLWIEYAPKNELLNQKVYRSARVGVAYAGSMWAKKLYRYSAKKL